MQFWFPALPTWVWGVLILGLLVAIHLYGVESFGESEYYLSGAKVLAIVVFLVIGVLLDLGAVGDRPILLENWKIPGAPIKDGFVGVFQVFSTAFFSFGGTELIGITAGEAVNPRVNVPKSIKGTFWRILLFYLGSIAVMGLVIRNDDPSLLDSAHTGDIAVAPFTLVLKRAGMGSAAHIMNGVIFIAILSAGNSAVFAASRTLMALSLEGKAPKLFCKLNNRGVPYWSVCASFVVGCLSFLGIFYGGTKFLI